MDTSRSYVLKRPWRRVVLRVLDGLLAGLTTSQPRPFTWAEVRRLLIIRLDHVGDVVLSLPVYQALKRGFPGMHITALVSPDGAMVLRDEPSIDELWTYEAPWFARHPRGPKVRGYLRMIARIRQARFDAAIDLRGDLRHIGLLWLAGVALRIGYGGTGGGPLLTHELPINGQQHVAHKNLALLTPGGMTVPTADCRLQLKESREEEQWVRQFVSSRHPWLILHPSAGTASKRWPAQQLETFLLQAHGSLKGTLFLVGLERVPLPCSASDSSLAIVDLRGKTSLRQLLSLLLRGDLLISTDSGPLHLGAAVGIPCLALWSGTNTPAVWAPPFPHVHRIQYEVPCQYCELRVCPINGHPCMSGILPEEVLRKAQALLHEYGAHPV